MFADDQQGIAGVLTDEQRILQFGFTVDSEKLSTGLRITIDVKTAELNTQKRIPHHFVLTVACDTCRGSFKQRNFSTFPMGNAGKFHFEFDPEQMKLKNDEPSTEISIQLTLKIDSPDPTLKIPVNIYWNWRKN